MREPNDESPRRFRLVGAPTPADPDATQPQQVIADTGARACFRRRHDTQIAEARESGRREAREAATQAMPSALVPEEFLLICRSAERTPREFSIVGVPVMVVPSRQCSDPDPDAELVAWEALRAAVTMKVLAAASGRECEPAPLPRQVAAAYWQDASGNQLRITADHSSLAWIRRRLGRPGGVASLVPVIGLGGTKLALGAVLTVGVVAVVVTPGGPVSPHSAEAHHPHDIVQEFVPSLGAYSVPAPAKPRKQLVKRDGSAGRPEADANPAGDVAVAPVPTPVPQVPAIPIEPSAAPEALPEVPPTVQAAPSEAPTVPVPTEAVPDVPTLDVIPSAARSAAD